MNPAVEGYSAAILEVADAARLADELAAVVGLVEHHDELRSVLTDTAVTSPVRRSVLAEVLEGRVSEPAQRLAAFAVSAVRATDALAALRWVAARAGEGAPSELSLLGHQAARARVGGYADALFATASRTELEEVEDELFRFARVVESNPQLRAVLTDRELPVTLRQGIAQDLLAGRAEEATVRLVRFVVVGGRPRDFVGALDWLVERTAQARGWRVARVRAAAAIDDPQREAMVAALQRMVGVPVELQVRIDSELLSGVVVEVGDLRVDASARGRLERLREELVPASAGTEGPGMGEP
jgi:F-type H+-transporting ATPase subunit delta